MSVIEIKNLTRKYGSVVAIDDLSLEAGKEEILALVGPDGSGKTSTFRAACGLINFDSGQITIAGYDVARQFANIKPLLGYMPQSFSLYPDLTVEENLYFYAGLFGVTGSAFHEKKKRLYQFSGLGPFHDRRAVALSGGMKQKLALSCALIHDPEVLLLDEPTTGVDPLSRRQFWDILKNLRDAGSTIMVSTPYMDEVAMADRAIFIYQGRKLAEGTPSELVGKFSGRVYRTDINPTPERMERINRIEGLTSRRFGSSLHIYTAAGDSIERCETDLEPLGIEKGMMSEIKPELEDTFIQLMGK
jgi:ABC-type multidrug transport system ATPase subunit